MSRIWKNIYRGCRSVLPPIPKMLPDAHRAIDQMDTISTDGEQMSLLNDKNLNIDHSGSPKSAKSVTGRVNH